MKRGFNACQTHRSMYSSIFNRFPVIQPASLKVRHFSIFFAHFGLPGYAPGTIAVNVTWIERQFNAGQTRRSMYPSVFNRLRAIARYWSEIATFSYPLAFSAMLGVPIEIPGKRLDLGEWRQFDDRLSRFEHNTSVWQTDGRTDRRTDGRPAYSYNVRQSSDAR